MSEASLGLDEGDDLEPSKVNLQELPRVLGDVLLGTPGAATLLVANPVTNHSQYVITRL